MKLRVGPPHCSQLAAADCPRAVPDVSRRASAIAPHCRTTSRHRVFPVNTSEREREHRCSLNERAHNLGAFSIQLCRNKRRLPL